MVRALNKMKKAGMPETFVLPENPTSYRDARSHRIRFIQQSRSNHASHDGYLTASPSWKANGPLNLGSFPVS